MVNLARGLSLIELLIALVIAAILITIGVPSLNSLLDRFRAENAASQWQTDLVYARQLAVAYQTYVTLCPRLSGAGCDGDWAACYTVFIDVNSNGNLEAGDEALHQRGAIDPRDHVKPGAPPQFHFNEEGFSTDTGILVYCPSSPDNLESRGVSVSSTGQARQIRNGLNCE